VDLSAIRWSEFNQNENASALEEARRTGKSP
jgi:hypothetical protein